MTEKKLPASHKRNLKLVCSFIHETNGENRKKCVNWRSYQRRVMNYVNLVEANIQPISPPCFLFS